MAWIEIVTALTFLSVGCLSQEITTQPQNMTAFPGGNVTFTCMAIENGTELTIGWRYTPSGSLTSMSLGNGTNVSGVEMVTVGGGALRTELTFSRVQLEANEGTVVCLGLGLVTVESDPAILTVEEPPTPSRTSDSTAAIVGGVVGGFFGVIIICGVIAAIVIAVVVINKKREAS